MSITFIPDVEFQQVADTEWTVDGYGLDNALVLMRGPRTKVNAYMLTLVKFSTLTGYPFMWLLNWEKQNTTSNFPGVLLHYVGFKSGTIPPAQIEDDTAVATATATGVDAGSGSPTEGMTISGTFTYLASRTTWTFFYITAPPGNPPSTAPSPFNLLHVAVAPTPIAYSIQPVPDPDTGQLLYPSLSGFTTLINSLSQTQLVVEWSRTSIIPGYLWVCRSVVQVQLNST